MLAMIMSFNELFRIRYSPIETVKPRSSYFQRIVSSLGVLFCSSLADLIGTILSSSSYPHPNSICFSTVLFFLFPLIPCFASSVGNHQVRYKPTRKG